MGRNLDNDVELIIDGATAHADDNGGDLNYEVGDLQEALRLCWRYLGSASQQAVLEECASTIEWGTDAEARLIDALKVLNK